MVVSNAPPCLNGKKDGTETGIDCGGSCPACPNYKINPPQKSNTIGSACGGLILGLSAIGNNWGYSFLGSSSARQQEAPDRSRPPERDERDYGENINGTHR